MRDGEWKWRKVINTDQRIRRGRAAEGFVPQPFDKEWQKKGKEHAKARKDKAAEKAREKEQDAEAD